MRGKVQHVAVDWVEHKGPFQRHERPADVVAAEAGHIDVVEKVPRVLLARGKHPSRWSRALSGSPELGLMIPISTNGHSHPSPNSTASQRS